MLNNYLPYDKSTITLKSENLNNYIQYSNNTVIYEGKWKDDFSVVSLSTACKIFIYKNHTFIFYDDRFKILRCSFREILKDIKIKYNNFIFIYLSYELGYEQIFDQENLNRNNKDLLGVINIPYEFIYKEKNNLFKVSNKFKSIKRPLKNLKIKYIREISNISEVDREKYLNNLNKCRDYIKKGFTYQINYTERFTFNPGISPGNIFDLMRKEVNHYNSYFPISRKKVLLSNTPELLFEINGENICTSPIKGTINKNVPEYKEKLLNSKKDLRELAMIVDLLRNDICGLIQSNTLKVEFPEYMELNELAHLYGNIRGKIKDNLSFMNIIENIFPGGSITGVPKKETMRIINELESSKRGFYTGSLGYISENNIIFNILIRSVYYTGTDYVYGSGGGITYWSDPVEELKETELKKSKLKKFR